MILAGATSLREVIAFPKTAKAIDLMVDAPSPATRTADEGTAPEDCSTELGIISRLLQEPAVCFARMHTAGFIFVLLLCLPSLFAQQRCTVTPNDLRRIVSLYCSGSF